MMAMNLRRINILRDKFKLDIGLSDHSLSSIPAIISVTKDVKIIEKHVTFSRSMYGSDAKHSMTIEEFKVFIDYLNQASVHRTSKFVNSIWRILFCCIPRL